MKKIIIIAICLLVLGIAVRYLPVYKKGYSFSPLGGDLTLARNFATTGELKLESEKNIILSSVRVSQEGIYSNWGNKLTPYIWGYIFKWFGFREEPPLYVSLLLWSLSGVMLFFLALKLFNLRVAVIFGLLDIFMPVVLQGSLMAGFYEWAVLFFSAGLFFYLWPKKVDGKKLIKPSHGRLLLASIFFGLASLARNAFLISFVPFLVYDFWKNKSVKRVLLFLLPVALLWAVFLFPGYIAGQPNTYLSSQDTSFGQYGHLFPDPYTYHFEKESYIQSVLGTSNYGFSEYLIKYGYPVSFKNQLIMYWHSIQFYPTEFLKLIVSGGPLIILFLLGGLVYLFNKKNPLGRLFVLWGALWYFLLLVPKSNNWNHFLELRFPMILLMALGISWLFGFIMSLPLRRDAKYISIFVFSVLMILHFIQANKWMLHEEYSGNFAGIVKEWAGNINQQQLDKQQDVIAVNIHPSVSGSLNYHTDQNIIYFDILTIKKLLSEQRLLWAFDQFGVTKIIGFDREITEQIIQQTGVEEIK